jgi:hypothetical protein
MGTLLTKSTCEKEKEQGMTVFKEYCSNERQDKTRRFMALYALQNYLARIGNRSRRCGSIEIFVGPYGPPWARSDFSALSFSGKTADLYGWDDTRWYADSESGGQNDVEGAASYSGDSYCFEFRKRLNSGDGYDWNLKAPRLVNLMIGLFDDGEFVTYEQTVFLRLSK